jgi:hypothetical protein
MQENDTERAVRAALATQQALITLSRITAEAGRLALAARLTIDSGPLVIDAAGEILGVMPNIVAQAQALAEPGVVVVTARVQRQVANLFVAKERGSHQLKGVPEAVTLYGILRSTGGGHGRPDYDRLLTRALKGVDMSTAEARQAAYERARNTLVAQLRFNQPTLSNADIAKERLALEDAIRTVEAEAARKSRTVIAMKPQSAPAAASASDGGAPATGPPQQDHASPPPANAPWADWPAEELADAGEQLFIRQISPNMAKESRNIPDLDAGTARAAKSPRQKREVHEEAPEDLLAEEPAAFPHQNLDQPNLEPHEFDTLQEPVCEPEEELPIVVRPVRTSVIAPTDKYERARPSLSYGALARLFVVLIILIGVVATISWQWSTITELYQLLRHNESKRQSAANHKTPSAQTKFLGGLSQEQEIDHAPRTVLPSGQTVASAAQRVVLREEDRNDQHHRQYLGSAIWRTIPVSPGVTPELAVVADADIPEPRMTVAWSLRRNMDKSLPATHTIEVKFDLPADFPGGGIANVSGILMAEAEQTRGAPLAGLAVKVTDGFFVIGLSAVLQVMQRNEQLLKDRPWFYIPIVYANGGRAIPSMEKGPSGDRALAEAFASWKKR